MKRLDVVLKMREIGAIPLYYHPDIEVCKEVISACYRGGMTIFEFTNRGDFAHELFAELVKWAKESKPDLVLGVGTVLEPGTCSIYIQLGAKFIVSPLLNEDMAKVCNRRKVLWLPGCATASEINKAEELGAEVVKLFPGPTVGGAKFLKAYLGPCPWSNIMPSGGVSPTEENLTEWFGAGAFGVGIGSQLISKEIIANKDYIQLEKITRKSLEIIQKLKKLTARYLMKFKLLTLLLVTIPFLFSCNPKQQGNVLKLAHGLDPSHPVHSAMVYMADRCKEISEGKLTIEIYPSGQLGSEQQCVELVQIGSLAITKVSAAVMESFTEDFKVLGLPYVFRSKEHSFNVLDGEIGDELLLSTEPFWIRGLCFYDAGSRSFYTLDKSINHPDDLKGLKIRVMKSITAMEMVKAQGGSPTPISWGELYTALQSGVVDGAENNPPSFYTSHHYEVCKYYSLNEHTMVPDVLIVSQKVWKKLTDLEKKWLQQAADESVTVQRKLWAESEIESLEFVQNAGVTITYPDKAPFAEKVAELLESYRDDEKIYDLITRIKAVK